MLQRTSLCQAQVTSCIEIGCLSRRLRCQIRLILGCEIGCLRNNNALGVCDRLRSLRTRTCQSCGDNSLLEALLTVEGRTPGSVVHHLIPLGRLDEHRTVSVASDTMLERLAVIRSDYLLLSQLSVDVGRLRSQKENYGTDEW